MYNVQIWALVKRRQDIITCSIAHPHDKILNMIVPTLIAYIGKSISLEFLFLLSKLDFPSFVTYSTKLINNLVLVFISQTFIWLLWNYVWVLWWLKFNVCFLGMLGLGMRIGWRAGKKRKVLLCKELSRLGGHFVGDWVTVFVFGIYINFVIIKSDCVLFILLLKFLYIHIIRFIKWISIIIK